MSIRAILFDFDGVLADSEPIHYRFFREVLADEGIPLVWSDYQRRYLGLDDHACFEAVYRDSQKKLTPDKLRLLIEKKNRALLDDVSGRLVILPGVKELIARIREKYYLAIVSGALNSEIETMLNGAGLLESFRVIVGAEDVSRGKPDPAGFLTAVKWLNRDHIPESEILLPAECLVVEDSPWGIEAASRAGIPCVAVTTSYPAGKLKGARWQISQVSELESILEG